MNGQKNRNASFVVLFKDNSRKEVFMVFRTDYPIWVLTGGGIEENEKPREAATRETKEETGFDFKLLRYLGKCRYSNRTVFLYEGRFMSGSYKPEFEGNIGRWFRTNKLPKEISFFTRQRIIDAINFRGKPFTRSIKNELLRTFDIGFLLRHPVVVFRFWYNKWLHT